MPKSWRISDSEYRYLQEMLDGGFPETSEVNFIGRLEEAFAAKFESGYAIAHNNGTATLHSALVAAGVGAGDEVIVPPLTMASTSLAVLHQNARPVFADIDPETFTIDPESIRRNITPHTKAIIPVPIYGLSCDMDPIMAIAAEHGLVVIEDAAQCFLGRYHGRLVGTLGDMASFSFQNSKHMASGEGGMVITSNPAYAEAVRRFSCLGYAAIGQQSGSRFDKKVLHRPDYKRHVSLGYNYRIAELCAAVALAQLEKLDALVAWRKKCAAAYDEVVGPCPWLKPQRTPAGYDHACWAYVVAINASRGRDLWERFYDKFVEFGGRGFYGCWSLTYLEPAFQNGSCGHHEAGICPVAEMIQPTLMQFKTHFGDDETIDRQAGALEKTIKHFS